MRVLVAGRNAKALATAAGTFANDLTIQTAATKAACFALLERAEFDLIVACETLGDGSGLEVLSHAAVNTPDTLRIFAARPSTLKLLKGELGLFGLFRTLSYPINFRKLWAALDLARSCSAETEPGNCSAPATPGLLSNRSARTTPGLPSNRAAPTTPGLSDSRGPSAAANSYKAANDPGPWQQPQHLRPAQANIAPSTQRQASPPIQRLAAVAGQHGVAPAVSMGRTHAVAPDRLTASPARAAAHNNVSTRRGAAANGNVPGNASAAPNRNTSSSRRSTRIPESAAFKRAVARRNASKLDAHSDISAVDVLGAAPQTHDRREPAVSNDSLAQLARLTTTHRPTYEPRGLPGNGGKKRAALFVGSGVFAAVTAAVLTFFMLNANNSIGRSSLPMAASIDRPIPQKVLPWQPAAPQQPTSAPPPPIRGEAGGSLAADLELQAEAESELDQIEPGHPGPPPPNPPPGPSEPPSSDSSGTAE